MKHESETMLRSKCESGRPQGKTSTLPAEPAGGEGTE